MKNVVIFVAGFCLALVGFTEKAMAGPMPISAQESSQLNELAGNDALLSLKAGGSFPNAPKGMEATEKSILRNLEAGTPDLSNLKAGHDTEQVLIFVALVCVCVLLLRAVL